MSISVSIIHAPFDDQRRAMVKPILSQLIDEGLSLGITVSPDLYHIGIWPTAKIAWQQAFSFGATHHIVLQDDIQLCKDFLLTMSLFTQLFPDNPVCPYCPRKIIEDCRSQNNHWASIPDGCWGQAFMMPVTIVTDFLTWTDRHIRDEFKWDDSRVGMFLVDQHIPAMVCAPSLVEHLGASSSIAGIPNKNKVARWFIGANKSGLEIDWQSGMNNPVRGVSSLSRNYYKFYVP